MGDELDATSSAYGGLAATQNAAQISDRKRAGPRRWAPSGSFSTGICCSARAAFETEVTNARETAPAGLPGYTSGQIVPGAAYRARGLDFEAAGKLTGRWSVLAGFVVMDPKITRSIVPTNVGLQLANIAPQSFNLLTRYRVTRRIESAVRASMPHRSRAVRCSPRTAGSLIRVRRTQPSCRTGASTCSPRRISDLRQSEGLWAESLQQDLL